MSEPHDERRLDARREIDEAIGSESRVAAPLRLPDACEPLSAEDRARIIAATEAHLAEHGIAQRELATGTTYDPATINHVLRGRYRGNADAVLRVIAAWIADDARRRAGAKPAGYFETSVALSIRSLAAYAKSNALAAGDLERGAAAAERPRIVIGYGPAGCGKTLCARAYCAEDPRAVYVRVCGGMTRIPSLAEGIVSALSVRGPRKNHSIIGQCYAALRGSLRLLIVDEGHRLSFAQAEFIRDLSDVCGVPVLILATQEFYVRLTRVRRREGAYQYDQFTSRVGYVVDLLRGADGRGGERRPYYSLAEIRSMFKSDQVRLTPDGEECLQALACLVGGGMLRTCATVFDKAARSAARRGGLITLALLESSLDASLVPAGLSDTDFRRRVREKMSDLRRLNATAGPKAAAG